MRYVLRYRWPIWVLTMEVDTIRGTAYTWLAYMRDIRDALSHATNDAIPLHVRVDE